MPAAVEPAAVFAVESAAGPTARPATGPPSSREANAALRAYAAGRLRWTPHELEELSRLRAIWQEAIRREVVEAA